MTKQEKEIYVDIIMGVKELEILPNGKKKNLTNIRSLKQQELIDTLSNINKLIKDVIDKDKNPNIAIVECINNKYHEKYLTIGKQYLVIRENEYIYNVKDDSGWNISYNKADFKLV